MLEELVAMSLSWHPPRKMQDAASWTLEDGSASSGKYFECVDARGTMSQEKEAVLAFKPRNLPSSPYTMRRPPACMS